MQVFTRDFNYENRLSGVPFDTVDAAVKFCEPLVSTVRVTYGCDVCGYIISHSIKSVFPTLYLLNQITGHYREMNVYRSENPVHGYEYFFGNIYTNLLFTDLDEAVIAMQSTPSQSIIGTIIPHYVRFGLSNEAGESAIDTMYNHIIHQQIDDARYVNMDIVKDACWLAADIYAIQTEYALIYKKFSNNGDNYHKDYGHPSALQYEMAFSIVKEGGFLQYKDMLDTKHPSPHCAIEHETVNLMYLMKKWNDYVSPLGEPDVTI